MTRPRRSGPLGVFVRLGLLVTVALLAVTSYYWVEIPFVKFTLQAGECKWGPPLAGVYLSGRLRLMRPLTGRDSAKCGDHQAVGDLNVGTSRAGSP